jgi:hypothetical protein
MAGYKLVCRIRIVMLLIPLGEHVLFLRLEHGKPAYLLEIAGQAAFS